MRARSFTRYLPVAIATLLVLLLAVLAVLQWRWIGEVSAMEQQRMRASLLSAGFRFSRDFDREVGRALLHFHPDLMAPPEAQLEHIVRQYERWQAEAPYPRLVRDVFLVRLQPGGEPRLEVLRLDRHRFESCPWPAELAALRKRWLQTRSTPSHLLRDFPVSGELPGLLLPLGLFRHRTGEGSVDHPAGGFLLVQFDRETIAGRIFPALARQYFETGPEAEYAVMVVDAQNPRQVLFRSDPQIPLKSWRDSDLSLGLFRVRPFEELTLHELAHGARRSRALSPPASGDGPPPAEAGVRRGMAGRLATRGFWHDAGMAMREPPEGSRYETGAWRLMAKRRDGSLEQAVAGIRHRNLAISLGILALLAASVALLMVTTQRAQRLARQQIEFVAGVTHELNTPLTAIRSAGQNLADGVVAEPGQVRRYGTLIANEGRRLSDMVGQALEFAGIQSGRRSYHLRPAEVAEIVDGALEDGRWLLQETQVELDRQVEPGLPAIEADAPALRRAVQNLVENAVKYGGQAGWIGVRARRSASGGVEITVADRGPGIRTEDLPHLFEPFFRGRDAAKGGVPGSGLGLSLVRHTAEAHGGRVTVETAGEGSAFTLHLPAAAEAAAMQAVEEPA